MTRYILSLNDPPAHDYAARTARFSLGADFVPRAPGCCEAPELRWWRIGELPVKILMRARIWGYREYRTERGARVAAACVATVRASHGDATPVSVVVPRSLTVPERDVCAVSPMRWPGAASVARAALAALHVAAIADALRSARRAS